MDRPVYLSNCVNSDSIRVMQKWYFGKYQLSTVVYFNCRSNKLSMRNEDEYATHIYEHKQDAVSIIVIGSSWLPYRFDHFEVA